MIIQVTSAAASPFARKVRTFAAVKGLDKPGGPVQVTYLDLDRQPAEAEALRSANPLNKLPTARLPDGTLIYDSHVICEYLDTVAPQPRLFPLAGPERWRAMTLAALGDGIMDAAILIVYEGRYRPSEKHHQEWLDRQQAKIDAAIAALDAEPPAWDQLPNYGHITIGCALGYLDLRQAGRWRNGHGRLVAWLDRLAAELPAFATTAPPKS